MLVSLKLTSGEELITEIKDDNESNYVIKNPVQFKLHHTGQIEAKHYLNFSNDTECSIPKEHVIVVLENLSKTTQRNYKLFIEEYNKSKNTLENVDLDNETDDDAEKIMEAMYELPFNTVH